jgi:ribosomal protein S18 acetylase RimI-like enzyme
LTQWEVPAPAGVTSPGLASSPAASGAGASETAASNSQRISVTDDYMDIEVCSKFFVESFWEKSTTTLSRPVEMTSSQRNAVQQEQLRDLQDRYGKLLGERKLKSALVVLRDEAGAIEACCGVELAVADTEAFELLSRAEGEQMLKGGLAALGGRTRNELRGQPVQLVAAKVLPQGYALIPVLSNLAVRDSSRGRGLAKQLCKQCEVIASGWGFSEMMLLVEEANAPARKLYESLGYQRVWTRSIEAARISPDGQGALTTEQVATNAMAKAL